MDVLPLVELCQIRMRVTGSVRLKSREHASTALAGRTAALGVASLVGSPQGGRELYGGSSDREYIDKNNGGVLLIRGHLFGSYQTERPDIPICYGRSTTGRGDGALACPIALATTSAATCRPSEFQCVSNG